MKHSMEDRLSIVADLARFSGEDIPFAGADDVLSIQQLELVSAAVAEDAFRPDYEAFLRKVNKEKP